MLGLCVCTAMPDFLVLYWRQILPSGLAQPTLLSSSFSSRALPVNPQGEHHWPNADHFFFQTFHILYPLPVFHLSLYFDLIVLLNNYLLYTCVGRRLCSNTIYHSSYSPFFIAIKNKIGAGEMAQQSKSYKLLLQIIQTQFLL